MPYVKLAMNIVKALGARALLDMSMLNQRECAGDQLDQPRDLLFAFHAKSMEQARAMERAVEDNNYGRVQAFPAEPYNDGWRVEITIFSPATANLLQSLSALMLCLAQLYHVQYEGWSCIPRHIAARGEAPHLQEQQSCAGNPIYGRSP